MTHYATTEEIEQALDAYRHDLTDDYIQDSYSGDILYRVVCTLIETNGVRETPRLAVTYDHESHAYHAWHKFALEYIH